ncbi:MAG: hypothetical protein M3R38_21435 [Actinomycetota bacterium]|nr:hypothetical protein [Actinomycetota bacterium]
MDRARRRRWGGLGRVLFELLLFVACMVLANVADAFARWLGAAGIDAATVLGFALYVAIRLDLNKQDKEGERER